MTRAHEQEWYKTMLILAKEKGSIYDWRDIVAQRDIDELVSTKQIPLFSGDYWPEVRVSLSLSPSCPFYVFACVGVCVCVSLCTWDRQGREWG